MGVPVSATPAWERGCVRSRVSSVAAGRTVVVPASERSTWPDMGCVRSSSELLARFLIFLADADSMPLYTWVAIAEAAAATPTPMTEPAMPIFDERANDVAAARALAITADMEKSLRIPPFSSSSSSA